MSSGTGSGGTASKPLGAQQREPLESSSGKSDKDAIDCPECGAHLDNMEHRRKHAIYHYGEDPIPRYHQHTTAAERKGILLGVDPETLRR